MKLLGRDTGLLLRSMEKEMTKTDAKLIETKSAKAGSDGLRQVSIDGAWRPALKGGASLLG